MEFTFRVPPCRPAHRSPRAEGGAEIVEARRRPSGNLIIHSTPGPVGVNTG